MPQQQVTQNLEKPRQVRVKSPQSGGGRQTAVSSPTALSPIQQTIETAAQLQRTIGNQAMGQLLIQPKLTLGSVGDRYEQEADAVAKQVVGHLATSNQSTVQPQEEEELQMMPETAVQRQEDEEMQLKRETAVQRQSNGGGEISTDIEQSIQSAKGSSQPMADTVRSSMENAFGTDFSGVNIHTNSQSNTLNQSLQARAFTSGQDIFFRQGEYNPGNSGGQELLVHELTHVVQQTGGAVQRAVSNNDPARRQQLIQKKENQIGVISPFMQSPNKVLQRLVIPAIRVGLAANIDTANLAVAEQQVNQLIDANRIAELRVVERELQENGTTSGILEANTNDETLLGIVSRLLENGPNVPEKAPMGFLEKWGASDAVANEPDVNEAWRTAINIWVVGDQQRGIVWGAIGNHLRGKIDLAGYRVLGVQCYLLLDNDQQAAIDIIHEPDKTLAYAQLAKTAFNAACFELSAGLGHLPDFNGTSYRQSGLVDGTVYNGKIAQGDVIMDEAFWSTSIFRGAGGAAGDWTDIGTLEKPIAYYIIAGTEGKYIAKYAKVEGEREVLFRNRTAFQVTRIVNLKNRTFFIYVTEIPPPAAIVPIKNPYTGNIYP